MVNIQVMLRIVWSEDKFVMNVSKICYIKTAYSRGPKSYFINTRNQAAIKWTGEMEK